MNDDYHLPICTSCYAVRVEPQRARMLKPTCAECGEKLASKVKHTIVPMHKSNYTVITDSADLKGINNKGGLHR